MFESVAHFVLGDHLAGFSWDPPDGDGGYQRLLARRPYRTSDGYLCVLVYNDKQWKSFLGAIGRPELMQDPRYTTQANRAANIRDIYAFLADVFITRTTVEWIALLESLDIPVAHMNTVEDVVNDLHLSQSGFFVNEDHPSEGSLRAMRTPTNWSESQPGAPRPAPRLGEHSAEVLREVGYSDDEIAELVQKGVTKLP
jgi:crotonobetainyl-CoA:carnitine CoA-transferase CaiB-like acyl-CoA transferase